MLMSNHAKINGPIYLYAITWILISQTAIADEYIRHASPHPRTASDLIGPIDYAFFEEPLVERFLWKGLKQALEDKPAFLRDTKLSYDHRTYYFARRNSSDDKPEA